MRRFLEDLARFLGIAQGIYFVVVNLGVGIVVLGAVTGMLALVSDLPWWSVAVIGLGGFTATTGIVGALGAWIAGKRASPITPVIESGLRLRAKIAAVRSDDDHEAERWRRRYEDWLEEAESALERLAPHRLGAFRVDFLWSDTPARRKKPDDMPSWVYELLVELDTSLDRLEIIRVSI